MAKKLHGHSFKGTYYHASKTVGEYNKKTETTTYYSLEDALAEYDGKEFSISFKEEDGVQPVEAPDIEG